MFHGSEKQVYNERILNNLLHMILKNKNDSDMCFTTRMITLPETNIGPEN